MGCIFKKRTGKASKQQSTEYKDIDYALARVLLERQISHQKPLTYSECAAILTEKQDPRTAGPIFCLVSDEIADISFQQAFEFLQQIWKNLLRDLKLPEQQITALFHELRANLPVDIAALLGLKGHMRACNTHFV